jgi:hypothetical protein
MGFPYEAEPAAYWALLDEDVELRRTDYDVELAVRDAEESGFPALDVIVTPLLDPPDPCSVSGVRIPLGHLL